MSCDARIRPWRHVNETEVVCAVESTEPHRHEGLLLDYAWKGSEQELAWFEEDRRTFRGEFRACGIDGCLLPEFHPGEHMPPEAIS
jgi:hypothetical protein